jgi:hypothetical protein
VQANEQGEYITPEGEKLEPNPDSNAPIVVMSGPPDKNKLSLPEIEERTITLVDHRGKEYQVQRKFVKSPEDLKQVFEYYKGQLKDPVLIESKATDGGEWWEGVTADGKKRRIEYQPNGEMSTNEGPHVKILEYSQSPTKPGKEKGKVIDKFFIEGKENGNY